MCGHVYRNEADGGNGSARLAGRRQSATVGSSGTQHHTEDEKSSKMESVRTDAMHVTACPSGIHVCKCVNSLPSKLSDVEGCPQDGCSGCTLREYCPTADIEAPGQSHISINQTAAADCCVVHMSSSS